ncbi:MAG: DinB family protein [Flavobacteriales bacterium]|nr:DinB family protein [Flavobacteriales bacterium]
MKTELILHQYDFNLEYAKKLISDLSEEQMTIIPSVGLENHAAWTIGHLVAGSADLVKDLGGEKDIPPHWDDLFVRTGPGDPRKPDPDVYKYPSRQQLIHELEKQHNSVKILLNSIDENKLNETVSWRFSNFMPTLRELVMFMCINHEAMHLGQLSAWRRALGLNSALASIDHS